MKHLALFLSFLVSGNVVAATDYTYCQNHFNKYKASNKPCDPNKGMYAFADCVEKSNKKDISYYPFELTSEGKIKPHPTANLSTVDGKEVISVKSMFGSEEKITIVRNDKGEMTSVITERSMGTDGKSAYGFAQQVGGRENIASAEGGEYPKMTSVVVDKLELKNGKCIPTRTDTTNSVGEVVRQDVNYDLKMCKDLDKFFKDSPEAAACFDKGLMQKAANIFSDYYSNNSDIYGEKTKNGPLRSIPQKNRSRPTPGKGGFYSSGVYPGMSPDMAAQYTFTPEQMVTPMGMTLDSILQSGGSSPLMMANNIQFLCKGMGMMGPDEDSNTQKIINDESVWAEAPVVESTVKSENAKK